MTKDRLIQVLKIAVVVALTGLFLTGCVKARVEVELRRDGSGTMSVAVGATEQTWALAGTSGEGLMQTLSQEASSGNGDEDVTVRRWTEGSYDWIAASRPFADLNELNGLLSDVAGFKTLSLARRRGLIRDRFIVDGEIEPLAASEEAPEDLLIDPSGMFEFQMLLKLPGEVIETNGVFSEDAGGLLWTVGTYEPLTVKAVSQTWNWTRIALILVVLGLVACALLVSGTGLLVLIRRTQPTAKDDRIRQAIDALKGGRKREGRQLLLEILKEDRNNAQAWLWMSRAVETDRERRECLQNVMEVDPSNERAAMELARLGSAEQDTPLPSLSARRPKQLRLVLAVVAGAVVLATVGFTMVWGAGEMGLFQGRSSHSMGTDQAPITVVAATPSPLPATPTRTPTATPDIRGEIREYQSHLCPLMQEALNIEAEEAKFWAGADTTQFITSHSYQQELVSEHQELFQRYEKCENQLKELVVPPSLREAHRLFIAHCSHFRQALAASQRYLEQRDPTVDSGANELATSLEYLERSLREFGSAADELDLPFALPCPDLDLEDPFGNSTALETMPTAESLVKGEATGAPTPVLRPTPEGAVPVAGSMVVDDWEVSVERVLTAHEIKSSVSDDFVRAAGRFVLIFLRVTNRGLYPRTFVAFGTLEVEDAAGRRYEEELLASAYAQFKYSTDIGADLNPDKTAHVVAVFDVSSTGAEYALVPGSLARQYTPGRLGFSVP